MSYESLIKYRKSKKNSKESSWDRALARRGYEKDEDGNIVVELCSPDGKRFGKVTTEALKAVEGFTLDSYQPKNEKEKSALTQFKNHLGTTLSTEDGITFGNVSYDAYHAIVSGKLDSYQPKNEKEKSVIEDYKNTTAYGKDYFGVSSEYKKNKLGKGNLDLTNRPVLVNDDGSISTVDTISIGVDGKEVLIPTIVTDANGKAKRLTNEEAEARYYQTGEHFGVFDSVEEANKYATKLHIEQDLYYDFLKNKQYKSSKNGKEAKFNAWTGTYTETGYDDILHDYINKDKDAMSKVGLNETQNNATFLGYDSSFLKNMTQEEIDTYNYYYNVYGKEAGKKYIDAITPGLKAEARQKLEKELSDYAKEHKVKASVATVVGSPLKVISALGTVADYADDGKIDQNSGYNKYVYGTNAIRSTVSDEIEKTRAGKVGSFLYNTGMSIGDSTMGTVIGGGNSFISLGTMGIGAFANSVVDAKDRGLSDDKAMLLGALSGATEIFTENFSLKSLKGAFSAGKVAGKNATTSVKSYILDNIKTNALEELGAEGLNFVSDVIISKDLSQWQQTINKYKKSGKSDSEAFGLAFRDTALQFASSALAGALSGAAMSGSSATFLYNNISNVGRDNSANVLDVINEGLSYGENTEAYKNAVNLFKNNTDTDYYQIGQQVLLNNTQKINTAIEKGLSFDKSTEAYKNAKKLNKSKDVSGEDILKQLMLNEATERGVNTEETESQNDVSENTTPNTSVETTSEETAQSEATTVEDVASPEQNAPTEQRNTFTGELDEIANTEMPSVNVGDHFNDKELQLSVKVIGRDENQTTIETTNLKTGKKETKTIPNKLADSMIVNDRYTKVKSTVSTSTTTAPTQTNTTASAPKNINLRRVGKNYEVYGNDALTLASEIDNLETTKGVVNGVETDILRIPADMADDLAKAFDGEYNLVMNDKAVQTTPTTANTTVKSTTTESQSKNPSVKVGDVYKNNKTGDTYTIAKRDSENTTVYIKNKKGVSTTIIPNVLADDSFNVKETFTKVTKKDTASKVENQAVPNKKDGVNETTTTKNRKPTEGEIAVVSEAIKQTLTPESKKDLEKGQVKDNYEYIAKSLINVYGLKGTITEDFAPFFADGGKKVDEVIGKVFILRTMEDDVNVSETKGNTPVAKDATTDEKNVSEPKVLKNQSESDTIKSKAEETSVEREGNDNERRSNSLSRNSRRGHNGSARKQNRRLFSFERKNKGKNETERYSFARDLIDRGQVEEVKIQNHTINRVNREAYNDDMLAMVEEAKKKGVELVFFVGGGQSIYTKKDGTKTTVVFKGLKLNSKQIFVQYDHRVSPQKIAKHETIHAKWFSPEFQEVKGSVLNSLTEEDKQNILSQKRYADYKELHNSEAIALEEFVCDVMSGMNEYTERFADTVVDYWYGNEGIDGYNVAEYAESIDAGGKRYSFGDVEFSERPFAEQVDAVLNGEDTTSTHLQISEHTPKLLLDLGLDDKPILITSVHTKTALGYKVRNKNTHYISTEVFKQLPQLIEEPAIVMESTKNGSIVMFVNALDKDNNPVVCSIKIDGKGNFNNVEVEANVVTSVYGKDTNPTGFIEKAVDDKRVLYWNKKMSQKLFDTPGLQLPDNINAIDSNVIIRKISRNVNTKISNIDTNGRNLSEGQVEYFKDSKIRDENGNLLVVYHGTRNKDFTVFKRNHNYYTDNRAMADSYAPSGAVYEGYLNITNPYIIDADGSKWSAIPISDEVKKMLDEAGSSTFKERGKWCTSVADIVSAISDLVDEGNADYDGVIVRNVDDTGSYYKGSSKNIGNDYITFKSAQFKNTDNLNPTENEDIRFDLSEPVEETKNLIAVHNLREEQVIDAINRNQFIMPSVAVTNKAHTDFGDVSIVFRKETIDPESNEANKLYGSDAWTPAQTRLKKNPVFDNVSVKDTLEDIKMKIGKGYSQVFDVVGSEFKDAIIRADGSIFDAYSNNIGFQTAYAIENRLISKVPKTKDGKIDQALLKDQLEEKLDKDKEWRKYKKWLGEISDNVITSYDASSNEDILNNMKAQPDSAKRFKLSETGELTVPAIEYSSIEQFRENEDRLSEDAESMTKVVGEKFVEWAMGVQSETDLSITKIIKGINSSFDSRYNSNDIMRSFADNGVNITSAQAKSLQTLYKNAVELPTPYFEAKPHRTVGLNEVAMIVVPDSAIQLKSMLAEKGIPYTMYHQGNDSERIDALNSLDDVRFDLSESDTEYMNAVENGDVETQERIIFESARRAGYHEKVYHGTTQFGFTKTKTTNVEDGWAWSPFFATDSLEVAGTYSDTRSVRKIADSQSENESTYTDIGVTLSGLIDFINEKLDDASEYSAYEDFERDAYEIITDLEQGETTANEALEKIEELCDDWFNAFIGDYFDENYNEKELSYDAFENSDEYEKLSDDYYSFVSRIKSQIHDVSTDGIYELYANTDGFFEIDAKEKRWNAIPFDEYDPFGLTPTATTRQIADYAKAEGYKGVKITNVFDDGGKGTRYQHEPATVYIFFKPEMQTKSADLVTYDDDGNIIPPSQRFNDDNDDIRYDLAKDNNLTTQKRIEEIANNVVTHEELIELAKKNTKEFVGKIRENESLQKRLKNAKRQMLVSPNPSVNVVKVGQVTKDILKEMDSTLKATDLKDDIMSIYNEYVQAVKKASGVKSKVQEANDNMTKRFAELAVDIADSSEVYVESEMYSLLKSYIKDTRIKIPDHAKEEADYAEFRKSHMGTFNLTNDGLDIDVVYQELCSMFPGMFSTDVASPADQLHAIAEKLESLKPYAYNPHSDYMQDAIEHIVYRFVSEVDGIAANPKTKAQKMAEKASVDKAKAIDKERTAFERKLEKHKKNSEKTIQKLQKKIDDSNYVRYWEKRLGKEEKARAVQEVRDRQKKALLKSRIRSIVSDMKKKLDKSEKTGGYPKELVKTVAEVCSALDFHTGKTNKDGSPTKTSLRLDSLMAEYNALKNNENYDFASEYRQELSDKISNLYQAVKDKRVVDLNLNELSELKDILSEISHSLSIATQQIGKANAKANAELAWGIIESVDEKSDLNDMNKRLLMREGKLEMQSTKAFILNPHRINEMIAGYDKESVWWQLHDDINRGNRKSARFVMEANKPFDELTDDGGNEIAFYDFRTEKIKTGIKYTDGTEVEIPKSIICEMLMMWNRKDGKTHLETGGAKIPDIELYNKGKTIDAIKGGKRTNPITVNDIVRLRGLLDSYDLAWIERAHHLFNKVSQDAINSTSIELVGRELARSENYIRMYVDSDFIGKEVGKDENNNITLEGHGSLKETKPKAKQPLLFRGIHENVYDNIDFVSKYYGLAIPIRNFNKVYRMTFRDENGQSSVQEVIGKKFGAKIQIGVVEQYIKDLQTPRKKEYTKFDTFKGNWLGATFWGNVSSALKQTSSYWTGSALLGEDALVKGLKNFTKNAKQTKAEIDKYSGTLYKRSQGLSTTELGDRANRKRLAGASSKMTKFINEHAPVLRKIPQGIRPGNWLQSMDVNTSAALWEACKLEVAKTMKTSDDGYMQAVTDLWERVIEETQSNYDVAHRPESLKSTNAIVQTLTMFTTDVQQKFGLLFSAYNDYATKAELLKKDGSEANENAKKEASKRLSKASRSIAYSALWMGFVSVIGKAVLRKFKDFIDDEEQDITASSVAEQYVKIVGEDLFNTIMPVGSSIILQAVDTFNNGYDFASVPSFDVVEDFIVSLSKVYKASTNDEKGDVLKALADSAYAISNFTGVPVKNVTDIIKSIKGYAGDIKELDFAHDIADYRSKQAIYTHGDLAECIMSGKSKKEQKILNYYSASEREIEQGTLTQEIKPAYVQMFVDSPEKASAIKRKLVLDYDYTGDSIDSWITEEWVRNVVEDFEYAEEIKTATQDKWDNISTYNACRDYYKKIYKKGKEKDIKATRDAFINHTNITENDMTTWEAEVDWEKQKKESKLEAEKEQYR